MRVVVWAGHLALPLAGLWMLLARPELDAHWEHRGAHAGLVLAAALAALALALRVEQAARRHGDARLRAVALSFLAPALFFVVHALLTPGLLTPRGSAGFTLSVPVGLLLGGALAVLASAAQPRPPRGTAPVLTALAGAGTVAALAHPAPLGVPVVLPAIGVAAAALYSVAAWRLFARHRHRPDVVLLSVITADALLTEAALAVGPAPSWQLSWWVWHVLLLAAFGFVGYAGWLRYRREGTTTGLFRGVALAATVADLRRDHSAALEELVAALRGGRGFPRVRERLAERFDLTDAQLDVLERGAAAVADERRHADRLAGLVEAGRLAGVATDERTLLDGAVAVVRAAFGDDRCEVDTTVAVAGPVEADGLLHLPLEVKGTVLGVLRASAATGRERAVLEALAGQLALAVENVRLYRRLDGLLRTYLPGEVASALVAEPGRAALGGELAVVSVLMADLVGFTAYAERTPPDEVVAMLNTYYRAVVPCVLAEGGVVNQFVGDAMMAIFGAPARQADHADRAVRAATALQAAAAAVAREDWPVFRVGVNSGPALVGNVGSDTMRTFTAIGDTTNLAARLESAAPPGEVVVGAATRGLLHDAGVLRALEPLRLKGRTDPVPAFLLDRGDRHPGPAPAGAGTVRPLSAADGR